MKKLRHVYIMYAAVDAVHAFETNARLKEKGIVTWIDFERLKPTGEQAEKRRNAILSARSIVFIASKEAISSGVSNVDLDAVEEKFSSRGKAKHPIIAVCFDQDMELSNHGLGDSLVVYLRPGDWTYLSTVFDALNKNANSSESSFESIAEHELISSASGLLAGTTDVLFRPEEFDIYSNTKSGKTHFFHGKNLDHDVIGLEFHRGPARVKVLVREGSPLDLGVEIQPSTSIGLSKAKSVEIVQTKNQQAVKGFEVPIKQLGKKSNSTALRELKMLNPRVSKLYFRAFQSWIAKWK